MHVSRHLAKADARPALQCGCSDEPANPIHAIDLVSEVRLLARRPDPQMLKTRCEVSELRGHARTLAIRALPRKTLFLTCLLWTRLGVRRQDVFCRDTGSVGDYAQVVVELVE